MNETRHFALYCELWRLFGLQKAAKAAFVDRIPQVLKPEPAIRQAEAALQATAQAAQAFRQIFDRLLVKYHPDKAVDLPPDQFCFQLLAETVSPLALGTSQMPKAYYGLWETALTLHAQLGIVQCDLYTESGVPAKYYEAMTEVGQLVQTVRDNLWHLYWFYGYQDREPRKHGRVCPGQDDVVLIERVLEILWFQCDSWIYHPDGFPLDQQVSVHTDRQRICYDGAVAELLNYAQPPRLDKFLLALEAAYPQLFFEPHDCCSVSWVEKEELEPLPESSSGGPE